MGALGSECQISHEVSVVARALKYCLYCISNMQPCKPPSARPHTRAHAHQAYFGSYTAISGAIGDRVGVKKGEKLPVGAALLAGGSAGFCYWLSCYPIDVVKARMQAAPDVLPPVYKGMTHAFKTIYRQEGYRAFFAGFTPCVLRAFPANAAAFVGFELALRALPEEL